MLWSQFKSTGIYLVMFSSKPQEWFYRTINSTALIVTKHNSYSFETTENSSEVSIHCSNNPQHWFKRLKEKLKQIVTVCSKGKILSLSYCQGHRYLGRVMTYAAWLFSTLEGHMVFDRCIASLCARTARIVCSVTEWNMDGYGLTVFRWCTSEHNMRYLNHTV